MACLPASGFAVVLIKNGDHLDLAYKFIRDKRIKLEMKAILLNEAGGVENLIFQDIDQPKLKKGEILINVKAIGINPADAG